MTEITLSAASCQEELKVTGEINTSNNLTGEIAVYPGNIKTSLVGVETLPQSTVLNSGQIAVNVIDGVPKVKVGDGVTNWNALTYSEIVYIE